MSMGHRYMFNTSQVSGINGNQGFNHPEQPSIHTARVASESRSIIHPVDNMMIQRGHLPSRWVPAPRSGGYSSSILNGELSRYQSMALGPSHSLYLHQSIDGNAHMLHDNYLFHPSSSNPSGQTIPGVGGGFHDQAIGDSRGHLKRKSPGIPPMNDRGSTSRYHDVGSSSDIRLPADPWQEKQSVEPYHMHWEYPQSYRVNSLSIGGEGLVRNVRRRTGIGLETNLARTHLPNSSLHHSYSNHSSDRTNTLDFWGHGTYAPREWNGNLVSPAVHRMTLGSYSSYCRDPYSLNPQNSRLNISLEVGGYSNNVTSNMNHVPQNVNGHLNQSVRGERGGHSHRFAPTFRASSGNFRPGHVASSEGQRVAAESCPTRNQHAFSNSRLHNVNGNGRNFIFGGRYRSYTEEARFHDRSTPEGLARVDPSAFYGSRAQLDQHRDMRLDIDNMSYEELLALGERIGSVSTGLSDCTISKCLIKSIYRSSDAFQNEGACVICLEEYKDMDNVGTLKACGHDFHVGCIRKWLSMKNSCPICKAYAMDDKMKKK